MDEDPQIAEVQAWFHEQLPGFVLGFEREGDVCWAHIESSHNTDVLAPKYGSGKDEVEAALSAKRRYEVEQIGSPNEGKPRFLP